MAAVFAGDDGGGRKRSSEKFAGNEIRNFDDRSTELGAAAHKKGRTSEISASRATPAYI